MSAIINESSNELNNSLFNDNESNNVLNNESSNELNNDNELAEINDNRLKYYSQFTCSICNMDFSEIIIENDAFGLCVLLDKNDLVLDIIPKFISCDLFIYDRDLADREIALYLEYNDLTPMHRRIHYSNYICKILPIYIDNYHWNIAIKKLKALYTTQYLYDFPYKILAKSIEYLNKSIFTNELFKIILSTCTGIFDYTSRVDSVFTKKIKKTFKKYTVDPKLRLPDNIPNHEIFIGQIISGLNCGYLKPMIDTHAEQFLSYLEEEDTRRCLGEKILNLKFEHIKAILAFLFNVDYINSCKKQNCDVSDLCYDEQSFNDIIQHMNITDDTFNKNNIDVNIVLSDIFNHPINTKFILYTAPFLIDKHIYKSYGGIIRLASYINNLLYRNDITRLHAIENNKFKDVLFNETVAKHFIKKMIVKFTKF